MKTLKQFIIESAETYSKSNPDIKAIIDWQNKNGKDGFDYDTLDEIFGKELLDMGLSEAGADCDGIWFDEDSGTFVGSWSDNNAENEYTDDIDLSDEQIKKMADWCKKHNNVKESQSEVTKETIEQECPKFMNAVKKFCADKNSGEKGEEYLIDSWFAPYLMTNVAFADKYKDSNIFSDSKLKEFEQKYLSDETDDEIAKFEKTYKI